MALNQDGLGIPSSNGQILYIPRSSKADIYYLVYVVCYHVDNERMEKRGGFKPIALTRDIQKILIRRSQVYIGASWVCIAAPARL